MVEEDKLNDINRDINKKTVRDRQFRQVIFMLNRLQEEDDFRDNRRGESLNSSIRQFTGDSRL